MKVTAYFVPNPDFIPVGEYKRTSIDGAKDKADMLLTACNGGSYTINTKGIELSGRGVKQHYDNGCCEVTESLLDKLREKYNIMTDF